MSLFSSTRERWLWLGTVVVLLAIYSTLGLAGRLAQALSAPAQELISGAFLGVFVGALVAGIWVTRRPSRREIGVGLGIAVAYLTAMLRIVGPAERTHLFEYGVVALLIHQALSERLAQGRRVPAPAMLAVAVTALLGWLDEGIQALLPNRVYDLRDVGFNALAGLMAVGSSLVLTRARRRDQAGPAGVIEETLSRRDAQRFYDRYGRKLEWSDPFEGRAKARTLACCALAPGERVLELGVGTGRFQAAASEACGPDGLVVGLDVSPTMLRLAGEAAPSAHGLRGSATALPFASASFDVVFSTYTLDLLSLSDVELTLREAKRVLRPSGRLALCSLTEGRSLTQRALMGLWKWIYRCLGAARVGGCRPLLLAERVVAAGFEITSAEHVAQLGIPSEVILARPRGAP